MSEWIAFIALGISISAVVFAGLSWRESRSSAAAATLTAEIAFKESAVRTRPWVSVHGVVPAVRESNALPEALFTLHYNNVGALPGHGVEIVLLLAPIAPPDTPTIDVTPMRFTFEKQNVIAPTEPGELNVFLSIEDVRTPPMLELGKRRSAPPVFRNHQVPL
jgi:hypothetical protein